MLRIRQCMEVQVITFVGESVARQLPRWPVSGLFSAFVDIDYLVQEVFPSYSSYKVTSSKKPSLGFATVENDCSILWKFTAFGTRVWDERHLVNHPKAWIMVSDVLGLESCFSALSLSKVCPLSLSFLICRIACFIGLLWGLRGCSKGA